MPLKLGQTLASKYTVKSPLNAGGFAVVFEGIRHEDQRRVAIKALRSDADSHDSVASERFIREAGALHILDHPNIVQVLDLGQTRNGVLYYVMEFLNGSSLGNVMFDRENQARFERPSPRAVVSIVSQILSALSGLAQERFVHRDLKPDNIFLCTHHPRVAPTLDRAHIKLIDLGFVKRLGNTAPPFARTLTAVNGVVGTPGYLSPELLKGQSVSMATDLFAVGIIALELINVQRAYEGSMEARLRAQMRSRPPASARDVRKHPLSIWVRRMLNPQPNKRFDSAIEAQAALRDVALRITREGRLDHW